MSRRLSILLCLGLSLGLTGARAGDPGSAPPPHVPGEIVLRLAPAAAADPQVRQGRVPARVTELAGRSLQRALTRLPRSWSALERRRGLDRVFRVRVGAADDVVALCRRLQDHPDVEYAHPNFIGQGGARQALAEDSFFEDQWALFNTGQGAGTPDADIDAAEAWTVTVGRRDTLLAVLDSGIDGNHLEFRGRIARGGHDFTNDDDDPEDDHAHGTNVTGLAGANANNRLGTTGVDWRTRFLPIKVLDASNHGSTLALANGLLHAAARGADVANLSLIRFPNTGLLRDAVVAAHDAGVILVGCNGNDGTATLNYPASYPEVLSVGWSDRDDRRAASSNFTSTLDVVAPGLSVLTTRFGSSGDSATWFSGCSAATPHAAGAVALLRALDPTLGFDRVRDLLRATADDQVGDPEQDLPGRDDHYGWGRLNIDAALQALDLAPATRVHVDDIVIQAVDDRELEVRVTVLDERAGAVTDAWVSGRLTLPDASTMPLSGTTTSPGVATLRFHEDDAKKLPRGVYRFDLDQVAATGYGWDPQRDRVVSARHDPTESAMHVGAIDITHDFETLAIEVQVLDDDDQPEGDVTVTGILRPADTADQVLVASTRWATAGVARLLFATPGADLTSGSYEFEVVQLHKSGFTHDTERDARVRLTHFVRARLGDSDGDGISNALDNCLRTANPEQQDLDGDGRGDACDVCPSAVDPAQRDDDADGIGNRCDCAPFDGLQGSPEPVAGVRFESPRRLVWYGAIGAERYDVALGPLTTPGQTANCLAQGLPTRELELDDVPAPGEGWFILVRANHAVCGAGQLGAAASPRSWSCP